MSDKTKERIIDAIISLVVGALITGISAFFQALLEGLQGLEPELLGSAGGTLTYIIKRINHFT